MFVFYPFSAFLRLPNCPVPRSFIPRISAISMFMAAFCALPLPVWRFDLKQIKNQFTIQSHFKAVNVVSAEDAGGDDPGFKGLIRYWKKHGIPIPSELLSDMADEKGKVLVSLEIQIICVKLIVYQLLFKYPSKRH